MVPDEPRRTSSRMPVETLVYATVRSGLKSNPLTLGRHDDGEGATAEGTDAVAGEEWSGWPDLNRRPPAPKAGALPGCATPRIPENSITQAASRFSQLCRLTSC